MTFLEGLQDYLRDLEAGPIPEASLSKARLREVRALFARLIDEESRLSSPHSGIRTWLEDDAAPIFARRFNGLLRDSIWRHADTAIRARLLEAAFRLRFALPPDRAFQGQEGELRRLVRVASRGLPRVVSSVRLDRYVEEVRFAAKGVLLAPAKTLLSLRGRDAIRWVLHVEAAQSTGPSDIWRVGRDLARFLLERPSRWYPDPEEASFLSATESLWRLAGLEVVTMSASLSPVSWLIEVTSLGLELLPEIADERPSPFRALASSMLADLTHAALQPSGSVGSAVRAEETAGLVRQMSMLTHELRNTLVPAQLHLGMLRPLLLSDTDTQRFDVVEKGLDRALAFVDELNAARTLVPEPEPVDVVAALKSAVAEIDLLPNLKARLTIPGALPFVEGDRVQFVRAFVNLLRNAAQSREAGRVEAVVSAEAVDDARALLLHFDDDGPGVPAEHRRAVFEKGFSMRKEGTGLGLSFVRDVVVEAGGSVECVQSPLGGARFTLRLPVLGDRSAS